MNSNLKTSLPFSLAIGLMRSRIQKSENIKEASSSSQSEELLDVYYPLLIKTKIENEMLYTQLLATFIEAHKISEDSTNTFLTNEFQEITSASFLSWITLLKASFQTLPTSIQKEGDALLKKLTPLLPAIEKTETIPSNAEEYSKKSWIVSVLKTPAAAPKNLPDIYHRLMLISTRAVKPHELSLEGIFGKLPNIAWTNRGPILAEDIETVRLKYALETTPLSISHVDKFPYLINYHIPSGVRIADGARVRLGAYLGEGATIMPAGYVNFNAGTEGQAMVEGRISAGVFVGTESDLGGGASIMGTLSGGGKEVVSIGAKCLIGANAGTGISLGFGSTIAAGVYVTAGAKVHLYNSKNQPIALNGETVMEGENIVKGIELSGREKLLFYTDSLSGRLICKPNPKTIELNPTLHKN